MTRDIDICVCGWDRYAHGPESDCQNFVPHPQPRQDNDDQVLTLASLTAGALADVAQERFRQTEMWGDQTELTFGVTGTYEDLQRSYDATRACERAGAAGDHTYRHILTEEFWEVMAATSRGNLREELIQLAAVAVAAVEALDKQARS